MTKNEIIAELETSGYLETTLQHIGKYDQDLPDLKQDILLDLLSKDDDLIIGLYERKQLKFFVTRMVLNNIRSCNSSFYFKYKKRTRLQDPIETIMNINFENNWMQKVTAPRTK